MDDFNGRVQESVEFIDRLKTYMEVKNDAELCVKLGLNNPDISKIRHAGKPVNARLLLKAYDATDLTIEQLREMLYKSN